MRQRLLLLLLLLPLRGINPCTMRLQTGWCDAL